MHPHTLPYVKTCTKTTSKTHKQQAAKSRIMSPFTIDKHFKFIARNAVNKDLFIKTACSISRGAQIVKDRLIMREMMATLPIDCQSKHAP